MVLDALEEQLAEFIAEFPVRRHKEILRQFKDTLEDVVSEYLSEMSAAEALEQLEDDASTCHSDAATVLLDKFVRARLYEKSLN
jgi:hypothetical protein